MKVLHDIEKKLITSLRESNQTSTELEVTTKLSPDQVRRGVEWLRLKNLVNVQETQTTIISLGKNGLEALEKGLPERRLLDKIKEKPKKLQTLQRELGVVFGSAMGLAKKNGWVSTGDTISLKDIPSKLPGEKLLKTIGKQKILESDLPKDELQYLLKRPDYITREITKVKHVTLDKKALDIQLDETTNAIDVEAEVPLIPIPKTHPLKDTINEIREIFVTLGFSEIVGNLSQSSFWNFDALFTPQDHPARELQDTFYLENITSKKFATPRQIKDVSNSHKKGWQYNWDINEAKKTVLRTHTTCITIKYLAENQPNNARVFSMGRVFRNEKTSYKHLVEFNQVEGIIAGKDANLRNLMGIQKEFYKRIGLDKIKFWPTFFPYTEPSLQTMVYNKRLNKWVELFGMGIFRPEVTKPLGIKVPVLAWGGGIERIAMLKYGYDDVREFYANDIKWLRGATKCQ